MLIDSKGVEVFRSKKNCLDKEAVPEKAVFYAAGSGLG